jgi:hypothetical protein
MMSDLLLGNRDALFMDSLSAQNHLDSFTLCYRRGIFPFSVKVGTQHASRR